SLYVLCIRQADRLVGLLPVYVYADPARGERQLLLVGAGTSDYLDGIFAPACTPQDILEALSLVAEELTWDVAYFTQLLPSSLRLRGPGSASLRTLGEIAADRRSRRFECPRMAQRRHSVAAGGRLSSPIHAYA